MALNPDPILVDIDAAQRRILDVVTSHDEASLRAPSVLPGWSRAHVLAHLATLGAAFMRQLEYAARGETIEVYDGGPAGREAGIQRGVALSAGELRAELARAFAGLDAAWPTAVGGWLAPVAYRDGVVFDVLESWWRETRIHLLDLGSGDGYDSWNREFCLHLWDFLDARLDGPTPYLLEASDDQTQREVNPGAAAETVRISGTLRDLTAWLAGRVPAALPIATLDGAELPLPELEPWPSGRPAPVR